MAKNRQKTATITLPVNNEHGIVLFEDLLTELSRCFNVEMNAKNRAYSFILSTGSLNDYAEFCEQNRGKNAHAACVESLIQKAGEAC